MTFCVCRTLLRRLSRSNDYLTSKHFSTDFGKGGRVLGKHKILGIETSCDDTGAAVVDENGNVLGNALHSQTALTVKLGGVLPPYTKAVHEKYIGAVVEDALTQAGLKVNDLDAVAVAVEPGLIMSLDVGFSHALKLVQQNRVPMIPIHHMQAHALTIRMIEKVEFPYLVLLVSGGHCLLAVARDVDDFLLLGSSTDSSPGEAFDKVGRRLKLKNLPQCNGLSFGAMIELIAKDGDKDSYVIPKVHVQNPGCDFSFAGIKSHYQRYIENAELEEGVVGNALVSNYADLCASFQHAVLTHLAKPVHRALLYCHMTDLLPKDNKTLVVSGGVACNKYIRAGLQKVCDVNETRLLVPPPELCTDNGIMIAWNGMEKHLKGHGYASDPETVQLKPRSPMGPSIASEVAKAMIRVPRVDL